MPGPAPKETRRRRNADTFSDIKATVVDDGERLGPPLMGPWSEQVLAWYEIWRTSPMAKTFVMTDWARLRMLAPLVEDYLKRPTAMKMAEIRQNESLLGATHTDRLKARMKVEKSAPVVETPAGVTAIQDYKSRLAG